MSGPVMIMAGGTGGHIFPALAVAQALRERNEEVVWLGTRRGMEARIVPAAGFALEFIRIQGLRRRGLAGWLLAPLRIALALADALRVLRRCRPSVVLGMGGYAAGPGGLAAWLLRTPLVIHEQNAVAGLTNRLLARLARAVLQAFPATFSGQTGARTVGNPVRPEILALAPPAERMRDRGGRCRLLVLGGSQGARAINLAVPAAVALLPAGLQPEIWHQAGAATLDETAAAYQAAGIEPRLCDFIDDMAAAYGWADLVVGRAGALTVSELTAAGLAAVLIPYPAAVDDHQTRNAGLLTAANAAEILPQASLSAESLAARLASLLAARGELLARAERARALAQPEAAAAIVATCLAQRDRR